MDSYATEHDIRALPIYRLGFDAGRDAGLVIALSAITAERRRLERITPRSDTYPSHSPNAACIAYADGRLLEVARTIGAIFRTGAPRPS